jgi:ribosomal protein L30E
METLRKEFKEGRLVIGTNRTIKMIRAGKIKGVYITSTAPKEVREQIKGAEPKSLKLTATELGKFLGKNFPISVCGVKK